MGLPGGGRVSADDIAAKKIVVVELLEANGGSVIQACKDAGVSRQWFYRWCKDDQEFLAATNEARDIVIDIAEDVIITALLRGEQWAAERVARSAKGARRGWSEKLAVEHSGGLNITMVNEFD